MFVGLEKISLLPQAGSRTAVGNLQSSRRSSQEVQPSVTANQALSTADQDLPVKIDDRVMVHNKKGVACRGTVKWIGNQASVTRKFDYPIAGLEMVSNIYR